MREKELRAFVQLFADGQNELITRMLYIALDVVWLSMIKERIKFDAIKRQKHKSTALFNAIKQDAELSLKYDKGENVYSNENIKNGNVKP